MIVPNPLELVEFKNGAQLRGVQRDGTFTPSFYLASLAHFGVGPYNQVA